MVRLRFLCLAALLVATLPAVAAELSLDEALALARDHSYALQRADLDLSSKGAALEQARADRLPELKLQLSSSYLSNPPEGISIAPGDFGYIEDPTSTYPTPVPDTEMVLVPDAKDTYFQIKADALWPIFTWGKLEAAVRVAELDLDSSGVDQEKANAKLRRDLAKAYFGLRIAQSSESVLANAVEVYGEIVADRERAFEEGAVNLESVLDARSTLRELEAQHTAAAQGRRTAAAGLRYLTGVEGEITPTDTWRNHVPDLNRDDLVRRARAWSPDLRSLGLQSRQAAEYASIQDASRLFRPNLAVSLSVEISGQPIPFSPNWREDWDTGFTLSLAADMAAWDWGKRDAAAREAEVAAQTAAVGVRELESSLRSSVQGALEQAIAAASTVEQKQASLDLAEERAKNARVSYENDLITREQALGAEVLALTAQLEVLSAGYAVESALLDLEFLVGGAVE